MRRISILLVVLLLAIPAAAGTPYFLDRDGRLWQARSTPAGLALTAERDGEVLVNCSVPFASEVPGASDREIQVAADQLTGKVAVVWQRNFSAELSEIMLAVWNDGNWENITSLTQIPASRPRFPTVKLSQISSSEPDPEASADAPRELVVEDSFLHIAWWEGGGASQHGGYALLCLTAAPDEDGALVTRNIDQFVQNASGTALPTPQGALEHPLFAADSTRDRALLFHGSRRAPLFQLVEISFKLEAPPAPAEGISVVAQRRRHTPVFGVRGLYPVPRQMTLEGARIILGSDLTPVAYRVNGGKIEYMSATANGWSPRRTLAVDGELTLDRAIPLIENLVH
ncbi:MAG: hypothetical protein V1750_00695 [Acidobacteriota bacterium]